ncbi:MAG: branched-chain amino acid ABC transporter substrate-binding protein [Hyphomicrobiaceae bacterium]|nr:branched-chain amino acid ABC transporter substrate-binding protein [Hyphomicrobiaceae bacterium]
MRIAKYLERQPPWLPLRFPVVVRRTLFAGSAGNWQRRWVSYALTMLPPMLVLLALPPSGRADHVVAVVATRNSPHQPNGEEIVRGVEAAARRVNASGGVAGAPVRVATYSEDCTRERAAEVAQAIARTPPAVVIGHLCAVAAMAAAPIYAKAGILLIAPGVRHARLTAPPAGPMVFRLAGREDRFGAATAELIAARHAGASVAVLGDRTMQGRALAGGVEHELALRRVAVVLSERLESGEKSYDDLARRIATSGAGVVIMPTQPIELGVVAASLRRIGVDAPLFGSDVLAVPDVEVLARQEGSRLVLMLPWTGVEHRARRRAHSLPIAALGAVASEAVMLRGEAAVEAWAHAATAVGTANPAEVASAMRRLTAVTAIGPLRFDATGDAMLPSYLPYVWRDGGWRVLDP